MNFSELDSETSFQRPINSARSKENHNIGNLIVISALVHHRNAHSNQY